ncbi:YncE family protein [Paraprevotella clara]|uniref:YncE family protein n=1 Tax=Paraprevotella clara TaxID=454154 RepID=UPI003AB75A67
MKTVRKILFLPLLCLTVLFACREIELVVPTEYELLPGVPIDPDARPAGMYLLNEANMGSNKSSIDYVDFRNAYYVRNIYAERNPEVVKELGDVGNDIQIYGNKLYAVINCSHKVEVMDVRTCKRIGQVDIPNCRYIRFAKGKAYVSAYVGPVAIDPNAQLGAVYEVDTASLAVTRKVTVGYQPDELEVLGEYLYVANSGGYRAPDYDSTVSVVEIYGMKQIQKIPVGINLHRIRKDRYGKLWVTSRGDYNTIPSRLYVLDRKDKNSKEMVVKDTLDIPCSEMYIQGDSLYFYSVEWNKQTERNTVTYGIIDVRTDQLVTDHFITDGTEQDIVIPYGICVHPTTGDVYVTDAKNYVSSGVLHCYDRHGKKKWSVRTGDIPAHMAFYDPQ